MYDGELRLKAEEEIQRNYNNEDFPDVMVDIETSGVSSFDHCGILQISAVKFNLAKGTVCSEFFDRCLALPHGRFYDEGTRDWWSKRRDNWTALLARAESPERVLWDFANWVGRIQRKGGHVMWGKPTHFDHSFMASYFKQFQVPDPFFYRSANDQNSFIRGRYFPDTPPDWERELPFQGQLHNGIFDALHQIRVLFTVMEDTRVSRVERTLVGEVLPPEA